MTEQDIRNVESTEFFYENMAMLGFENDARALVMAVKEAVDNSLDACEDINVLPEIEVELEDVPAYEDTVRLRVSDNASGIPEDEIENVFGEILYSSRFGEWRQTRGQQGIGISAVHLWGQKWIGEPTTVRSKLEGQPAIEMEIDSERKGEKTNVLSREEIEWDRDHGTEVELLIRASWRSRQHLRDYIEATHLANPSAKITYTERGETQVFERQTHEPPSPPESIRPHPNAADIGMLEQMISKTSARTLKRFLESDWCSMSGRRAKKICRDAGLGPDNPFLLDKSDLEQLASVMSSCRAQSPPTDALSPLGEELIEKTLNTYNPDFVGTSTRSSITVNGHPTIVETGVAYGGDIPQNGEVDYYRVANRVPLVYDSSGCALQQAVRDVSWDNYELTQDHDIPIGPAVIFVHVCSTDIDFGNEAKTFVASRPELDKELKLSLEECGREFSRFIKKQRRRREHREKVQNMEPIFDALSEKISEVTDDCPEHLDSLASSCNTLIVNENELYNPTDGSKNVTIDGKRVELGPQESVSIDSEDDLDLDDLHPIHA